ncbi:O-antigen translocase [Vibrio comitans]|uniref:LPS biosynthesis protein n=1 Tax=Vibrio comitans NBRC 102076 TaxID=1219078 RepID=A0A4Y3IR64_9VIBR|nr:O-antigen translocase [Vibrio comitans]GEA61983.1 LPS biosynthesis protein [Vibrio comitans NBRC 102076]
MNLAKTSLLSFVSTVVKLLSGLVINKAIALFIGPTGLALIGQFQNSQAMVRTIAQGGINNGVTKYTAEFNDDNSARFSLWSTSLKITIFLSITMSLLLILAAKPLSVYVFNSDDYQYVLTLFGFTLVLFSVNQLLLSILNGLKEIKRFIFVNIIQSIYSLVFTTLLIVFWKLDGALIALVTNQSVILLFLIYNLRKHKLINVKNLLAPFDKILAIKLSKYSLMTLFSALITPASYLFIRNFIGENLSWQDAGYWQAMMYISTMYLMVITTALSTYYLPRLSEIKEKAELRSELVSGYKIITPILLVVTLSVFFLKDVALWLLFTEEFRPMLQLFKWQLVGDFFKILSWLLAYLMLAKAMTKLFIITEIVFGILFVAFSILFVNVFGLVGISYAFACNYAVYFLTMIVVMRKHIYD